MPRLPSDDFQIAANAALLRVGEARWVTMTAPEQAKEIYQELSKIDADRARAAAKSHRERPSPNPADG